MLRVRTVVAGALCALGVLGMGTQTALATSSNVVISQVYGGGNNSGATFQNDFVELFNRGTTAASLSGWSVQYTSATGTGSFASNTTALSGSIPSGGYYLVKLAGGTTNGAALPAADATGTTNMSGTAGKVVVANTSTGIACNGSTTACTPAQLAQIVDLVGFGTANFFEGAAPAPALSNTLAALRAGEGCADTDDNAADFTSATPAPRNAATATHACDAATNPSGAGAAAPSSLPAGADTLLTVATTPGANPVSTGIGVTADLSAVGGSTTEQLFDDGSHGDVTAGDGTFSLSTTIPAATSAGGKSLAFTVSDEQGRTGTGTIALTVAEGCNSATTPIHAVQGSGAVSPVAGQTVSVRGVVVGDYQQAGGLDGYTLQTPDADADSDPATSEGVFVYAPNGTDVSPGDVVRVTGKVQEYTSGTSSLTEIGNVSSAVVCATGASSQVGATELHLPVAALSDFERYESMLVHVSQALTVSDTYTLGRYGELRLAAGGRLYVPTAVAAPGAAAQAQEDLNQRSSFVLDDRDGRQNLDPTRYPLGGLSAANTLRSGFTVDGLTAVFDDRFSTYRAQPVGPVSFTASNPRPETPPAVGGNVKVASFNVLNFFNGNGTHQAGAAGGFPTARGANTLQEFDRQKAKEISAIAAMDADVVGLMELENDATPNSAIEDLVDGLNAKLGAGTYAFVDTGVQGTDEIRVGLLYKPAKVAPVGSFAMLTQAVDPRFIDTKNRPSLAQTFELNANHRRLTVVVNHLKSKGSDCNDLGDPDTGDGQGNCNHTRQQAAAALVDWINGDPTHSGSSDALVIGDMNAYAFEDPIRTFTDAGYVNLVREHGGTTAYSYVFDGESGYLDHALATPSLAAQVVDAEDWHINADEPIVLDYNTEFKSAGQVTSFYDDGPFRASDHDPVNVGLSLRGSQAITFTSSAPSSPAVGQTYTVAATGGASGRPVTFSVDPSSGAGVCTIDGSTVTFNAPGTCVVAANQAGDGDYAAADTARQQITVAAPPKPGNGLGAFLHALARTLRDLLGKLLGGGLGHSG